MTTPERLRRRQRIEGALLILVGIAMLVQTWHFTNRETDQQDCIQRNFTLLSEALEIRGELNERETRAAKRVNLAELQVDTDEEYLDRLREYQIAMKDIQKERRDNPVPPYPPGVCD